MGRESRRACPSQCMQPCLMLLLRVNPSGCSAHAENRCSRRPRLVSRLWCLCVPRGVMGRFVVWESAGQHSNRGPAACLEEGFAVFGCANMVSLPQTARGVPAAGIDPAAEELQQIGVLQVSFCGSALSPCVPLSFVYWVVASLFCATWLLYLSILGRPPEIATESRKAKLSATLPLQKLGRWRWCGASSVYAWTSVRATREGWGARSVSARVTADPRLKLSVFLGLALDSELARLPQPKFGRCSPNHWTYSHLLRRVALSCRFPLDLLCGKSLQQFNHFSLDQRWSAGQSILLLSRVRALSGFLSLVRIARDCCANTLLSTEPPCPTAPSSGSRNCLNHHILAFGGLLKGLPHNALAVGHGTP